MSASARIVLLYALFATIATGANLASQAIITALYRGQYNIALSIVVGTIVGLPIKYLLDKKYIFGFRTANLVHDGKLFVVYGSTAVVTTAVFWGAEYLFQFLFGGDIMRLVGGAIGLVAGYLIKYRLDKRFVFIQPLTEQGRN